jgi:hypothetical protein
MQKHNRITVSVDNTNNARTQPNYGVCRQHKQCKNTTELRRLWTTQTMQEHNRITASVDNTNNARTQPNYGVGGQHKQCKNTTELRCLWTTQTMQEHNRITASVVIPLASSNCSCLDHERLKVILYVEDGAWYYLHRKIRVSRGNIDSLRSLIVLWVHKTSLTLSLVIKVFALSK